MYLTTVKELGTALLTKGTAFALTQTATQTNNSSVNDVLESDCLWVEGDFRDSILPDRI